jgi:hypothetical protein
MSPAAPGHAAERIFQTRLAALLDSLRTGAATSPHPRQDSHPNPICAALSPRARLRWPRGRIGVANTVEARPSPVIDRRAVLQCSQGGQQADIDMHGGLLPGSARAAKVK